MGWAPLENRRKIVDTKPSHGLVATPTRCRRASAGADTRTGNSGWLALLFGDAGVDCAVELVCLQLAFDICA